ncbi:hypothetical protein RvY_18395 [Ramazzottius varieornatus]|uniref:Helicase ATP-binding domain-containing protein n=1 Tax=Ramazzottius varieornatus TaxID=947166 RepID=A0A1D1W5K5_RAMVA|nr:hypothetical protein RvY_18395 [Ramazzottius varieornatus]
MYRNVIESVDRIQQAKYQGCILAYSMGLGKTLQTLAFLQAVLTSLELNLRTCLVLCPASVVLNWDSEVKEWMAKISQDVALKSFVLDTDNSTKKNQLSVVKDWKESGGVLIMGYSLYLSYCQQAESGKLDRELLTYLRDPGPDILVCDEAHMLKCETGKTLQCVSLINTNARIALTGTPLQNNLNEYYTMVNFVKPALLGSSKEFKIQFLDPIVEGSKKEAARDDVRLMMERSSILRHSLFGCLQIRGASILAKTIPNKTK